MEWIQPEGWPRPKGYSNGVVLPEGRLLVLAGQVGWDEKERIVPGGLVPQFEQALKNVLAVLAAAGGKPEHLVQLRLYLTDKQAYLSGLAEIGQVYRRLVGKHFPPMTGLVIAGLVEEGAMVELEALALLPAPAPAPAQAVMRSHQKTRIDGVATLETLIGKELPPTPWRTMAFDEIVKFADVTGDQQWIHVDRERIARESPYGAPIAHGYFSLSLIGGLFLEAVDLSGFKLGVNYGLNKVRFPAPLKAGARFRLSPRVAAVKPIEKGVEVVFANTLELEGEPKPACVAECVYRLHF